MNDFVILREIEPSNHKRIFNAFSDELNNFLTYQTHIYKILTVDDVVELLNDICDEYNEKYSTTISFYTSEDLRLGMESDNLSLEISLLLEILKEFKRKCRKRVV